MVLGFVVGSSSCVEFGGYDSRFGGLEVKECYVGVNLVMILIWV